MIIDKLENLGRYGSIIEDCDQLSAFFSKGLEGLPSEETKIKDSCYTFSPFSYTPKLPQDAKWETHHTHLDMHIILKGAERFDWIPAQHVCHSIEYVEERDVEFFSDQAAGSSVMVEEGYFVLVMPEDAHKPAISTGITYSENIKIVLKGNVQ